MLKLKETRESTVIIVDAAPVCGYVPVALPGDALPDGLATGNLHALVQVIEYMEDLIFTQDVDDPEIGELYRITRVTEAASRKRPCLSRASMMRHGETKSRAGNTPSLRRKAATKI